MPDASANREAPLWGSLLDIGAETASLAADKESPSIMAVNLPPVPYRSDAQKALYVLFGAMLLIVILVGAYAFQSKNGWAVFAGGCLVAIGAFAVGALLGLLFGVPHSGDKSTTSRSTWGLIPNTSLDQISDWLTKILVGVGLTQLLQIPSKLQALGSYLAPSLGGTDTSPGFSIALVISSSVFGFMGSWVWARLVLSADLAQAGADIANQSQLAVDRKEDPNAPLPPKDKTRAVTLTANLAKGALRGDPKVAKEVGLKPHDLERIVSQGLDTSDYDNLAEHAIHTVSSKADG